MELEEGVVGQYKPVVLNRPTKQFKIKIILTTPVHLFHQ
jgi:hypothetical protein